MPIEKRWVVKPQGDPATVELLSTTLRIPKVLANLLVQRGIDTEEKAHAFFNPQLSDLHDPFLMKDMDRAVERVEKAVEGHEKIMVFMQYISEWYVGLDNGQHYLALGSYIESCGGYSNVLAALAATQGLDARIVNLHNYPKNNGHTVCEIYYDGDWHIYDPTYGAFYTSTPENKVSPTVLSYEELSAGAGNASNITCVVIDPDRLTSEVSYGFLGPAIYEKADPKGIVSGENPMHYPLTISYKEGGTTIDRSQFDTSRQGISVLGSAYICFMQDWTLDGLTPGQKYQFILTADFVGGETGGDFEAHVTGEQAAIVRNGTHSFNNASPESMEWVIEFIAQADTVQLLFSHEYRGPDYHYITTNSFELRACS